MPHAWHVSSLLQQILPILSYNEQPVSPGIHVVVVVVLFRTGPGAPHHVVSMFRGAALASVAVTVKRRIRACLVMYEPCISIFVALLSGR